MSDIAKPRFRQPSWFYRSMMGFLGFFDRWLRLSCRLFIRLASEKYERPLGVGERMRQSMHRAICSLCRIQERRMEQLRVLAHEVRSSSAEDGRAELSPESVAKIRGAMVAAASPSGPGNGSKS